MLTEDIETFCNYFEEQITNLKQQGNNLSSRILWVTMLDALSRAGHPKLAGKNHDRIIKFIEVYAQWKDQDRCSLPQIALQLKKSYLTEGNLYKYVVNKIKSWPSSNILDPNVDPQFDEIIPFARCKCEHGIIQKCCYKELFYKNRNYLVHEFRDPGYGFLGLSSSDNVIYHQHDSHWELVFPTALFGIFCSKGVERLKKTFFQEKRNPYDAYEFDSEW